MENQGRTNWGTEHTEQNTHRNTTQTTPTRPWHNETPALNALYSSFVGVALKGGRFSLYSFNKHCENDKKIKDKV